MQLVLVWEEWRGRKEMEMEMEMEMEIHTEGCNLPKGAYPYEGGAVTLQIAGIRLVG